jgi:AcrR family transcriptional regulator
MSQLPGGLRKQPLQDRSRVAISRVLEVAAELVAQNGAEAAVESLPVLLERSGMSRGSFYAFFESPERVLDELALQCMLDSIKTFDDALHDRPGDEWELIVDALIDCYTRQFRIPLVRELWVRQQLSTTVRAIDRAWIDNLASAMYDEFQALTPDFEALTELHCLVALETLERLFQYAFRDDPHGDTAVIAEARDVVVRYLAPRRIILSANAANG